VKVGDTVKAVWSDGLEIVGKYVGDEQGYVILLDENQNRIVCNTSSVTFEVINESR